MNKTTMIMIMFTSILIVIAIMHTIQDQEIENHWEQVKYNYSEIEELRRQIENHSMIDHWNEFPELKEPLNQN